MLSLKIQRYYRGRFQAFCIAIIWCVMASFGLSSRLHKLAGRDCGGWIRQDGTSKSFCLKIKWYSVTCGK